MNSDANIAVHLSVGPLQLMVDKTSQVSLSFFASIWWITVDLLVITVVERYFRLGLKNLIPLKVNLLYINYCQGPSLRGNGETCPPQLLDRGRHNIFCPPQHFVMKSNVVVQISWYHYYWKCFPVIKLGNK